MSSSFYGGKQGITWNLVKFYNSEEQLNNNIQNDPAVNYGQYVMIGHDDGSSKVGAIYRKGLDGEPIYIGNIKGDTGNGIIGVRSRGDVVEVHWRDTPSDEWQAIGTWGAQFHVWGHFESITQVTEQYPYGLGMMEDPDSPGSYIQNPDMQDYKGWIVSVPNQSGGITLLAYDYNDSTQGWYQLEDLHASLIGPQKTFIAQVPDYDSSSWDNLNINGFRLDIVDEG